MGSYNNGKAPPFEQYLLATATAPRQFGQSLYPFLNRVPPPPPHPCLRTQVKEAPPPPPPPPVPSNQQSMHLPLVDSKQVNMCQPSQAVFEFRGYELGLVLDCLQGTLSFQ